MATEGNYPEFLQETMFQEHGTKVLITNPESDKYLEMSKKRKLKERYPNWDWDQEDN